MREKGEREYRRGRTGESGSRRKEGGERGGTESQHMRLPLVEQHRLLLNAAKYSLTRSLSLSPPSLPPSLTVNGSLFKHRLSECVCVCTVAPGCMLNTVPEILLQSNKAFSSPASRDNYCTSPREKLGERDLRNREREKEREREAWRRK